MHGDLVMAQAYKEPAWKRIAFVRKIVLPLWGAPPIYRVRGALFNLFERVFNFPIERRRFKKNLGYELNVHNPRSFNEKMVWKKLFDRNPLMVPTSDKVLVRDYVRETIPEDAEQILIPLLYAGTPEGIPFDSLPKEYITKANNDSGGFQIVREGDVVDRRATISRFNHILARPYGIFKHEWAYWGIKPQVIVERLLQDSAGSLAQDYKFHIFNGTCRFIHTTPKLNAARSGVRCLFTRAWEHIPVGWKHAAGPNIDPPQNLEEMLRIAERLAAPFDYVRVDLYNVEGRIYFGELTHYHGNGMERFDPESFDFEAGKWWTTTRNYWKRPHAT